MVTSGSPDVQLETPWSPVEFVWARGPIADAKLGMEPRKKRFRTEIAWALGARVKIVWALGPRADATLGNKPMKNRKKMRKEFILEALICLENSIGEADFGSFW